MQFVSISPPIRTDYSVDVVPFPTFLTTFAGFQALLSTDYLMGTIFKVGLCAREEIGCEEGDCFLDVGCGVTGHTADILV